jgi:hypothetical protein
MRRLLLALLVLVMVLVGCGGSVGNTAVQPGNAEVLPTRTPQATQERAAPEPKPTEEPTEEPTEAAEEPTATVAASPTEEPSATPAATETESPTPTEEPSPTATPMPEPIVLSGTGADITADVAVTGGLLITSMSHTGSSVFAVTLKDAATGEYAASMGFSVGAYEGTRAALVDPGNYFYEVEADGPWTLTVQVPGHLEQQSEGPYSFAGDGAGVTPLFFLRGGRTDIVLTHSGTSAFAATLYNASSPSYAAGLAFEVGAYDGRSSYAADEGYYLIDVEADGPWTVEVSQP